MNRSDLRRALECVLSRRRLLAVLVPLLAFVIRGATADEKPVDTPVEARPAVQAEETPAPAKPAFAKPATEKKEQARPEAEEKKPAADPLKNAEDAPAEKNAAPVEIDAAEPADEKKPEAKAAENPVAGAVQGLIRGLGKIVGRPGAQPADPNAAAPEDEKPKPANGDATARDHIDARAPYDRTQSNRIRQAQRAITEKNWRAAVDILQAVLDQPQDSLVRRSDGRWVSIRAEANRLLGKLPPEARDLYELQYGTAARQLVQEATEDDTAVKLAEAAGRYFYTRHGQIAADRLGSLAFDRGQFGVAARCFQQLLDANAPMTENPKWLLRAASAFRQAGRASAADALRTRIDGATGGGRLTIAGNTTTAADWLAQAGRRLRPDAAALEEWMQFQGNATRTGVASGGEPLLLPRWSIPLTSSVPVREQMEYLLEDLADLRRATIPSMFPLMVDGKAIFRTFRGFAVADVGTGKVLWETREGVSAERLLNGIGPGADQVDGNVQFVGRRFFVQEYMGNGSGDQHPLTSLLFRDANYGTASSDGRRLFVVEETAILSRYDQGMVWWGGGNPNQNDPYVRDWSSNKLAAYDLRSGRPLWDTGGMQMLEPFDLPLAGTFFFGPPTVDGDELLAVGERDKEIRLHVLDALTGRPRWSQLLAVSDTQIDLDFARRRWVAPVSTKEGILVCPTSIGWLVAVDRNQRGILWAHRYTEPQAGQEQIQRMQMMGVQMAQSGELNSQWATAAPIIAQQRIVFAPVEVPELVCLHLQDGKVAWKIPKNDALYLAGVFGETVVVVGKTAITGYDLDSGRQRWQTSIREEPDGRPSGFGVAVGDRYHLPLNSGQLWTLELATGKVLAKSYLASGQKPLGNLSMYRGLLLSIGPDGMTAFEQRTAVEEEIARRKQADPADAWALLREADMAVLNRDYPAAIERLRQVDPAQLNDFDRSRYRREMVESLTAIVRTDFKSHDREAAELDEFATGAGERLQARRLAAERLHARGDLAAAFERYLELLDEPSGTRVARADAPVTVRLDLWVAGRLADLWSDANDEVRAKLEPVVAARLEQATPAGTPGREAFARVFAFHPSAVGLMQELAEAHAMAGNVAAAEAFLSDLRRRGTPEVAAAAGERLARLWLDAGLPDDAAFVYGELERSHPDVALPGGVVVKEMVQGLRQSGALAPHKTGGESWAGYDLRLHRSPPNYSAQEDQELGDGVSSLPFFRAHRVELYPNWQRLAFVKIEPEEQRWIVPLRNHPRNSQGQSGARAAGHILLVLHHDVLHALSPVDRKVLWTRPIDNRGAQSGYYRHPGRRSPQPLRTSLVGAWNEEQGTSGMLAAANTRYVCLYGRRDFTVLDSVTGSELWTRSDVTPGSTVLGLDDVLILLSSDDVRVFRTADGKPLDAGPIRNARNEIVAVTDRSIVLMKEGGRGVLGLAGPSYTLRAVSPLTGDELWKAEFPSGAQFTMLDRDEAAVLRGDGELLTIDFNTGATHALGQIDPADLKGRSETFAFRDDARLYVMVNRPQRGNRYYFGEELPSVQANGTLIAFDSAEGKVAWKHKVEGQTLIAARMGHMPVLLFSMRTYVPKGNVSFWQLKLLALDKETGRTMLETTTPSNPPIRAMDLDRAGRTIEIRSYSERLRLVAVPRAAAEPPAPKAGTGG